MKLGFDPLVFKCPDHLSPSPLLPLIQSNSPPCTPANHQQPCIFILPLWLYYRTPCTNSTLPSVVPFSLFLNYCIIPVVKGYIFEPLGTTFNLSSSFLVPPPPPPLYSGKVDDFFGPEIWENNLKNLDENQWSARRCPWNFLKSNFEDKKFFIFEKKIGNLGNSWVPSK